MTVSGSLPAKGAQVLTGHPPRCGGHEKIPAGDKQPGG